MDSVRNGATLTKETCSEALVFILTGGIIPAFTWLDNLKYSYRRKLTLGILLLIPIFQLIFGIYAWATTAELVDCSKENKIGGVCKETRRLSLIIFSHSLLMSVAFSAILNSLINIMGSTKREKRKNVTTWHKWGMLFQCLLVLIGWILSLYYKGESAKSKSDAYNNGTSIVPWFQLNKLHRSFGYTTLICLFIQLLLGCSMWYCSKHDDYLYRVSDIRTFHLYLGMFMAIIIPVTLFFAYFTDWWVDESQFYTNKINGLASNSSSTIYSKIITDYFSGKMTAFHVLMLLILTIGYMGIYTAVHKISAEVDIRALAWLIDQRTLKQIEENKEKQRRRALEIEKLQSGERIDSDHDDAHQRHFSNSTRRVKSKSASMARTRSSDLP